MATRIEEIDKLWEASFKAYEKQWRETVAKMENEFNLRIAKYEKNSKEAAEAIEKAKAEYNRQYDALRKEYKASIDKLTAELRTKYEEDMKRANESVSRMEELSRDFEDRSKKLEEFRKKVEEDCGDVLERFRKTVERLHESVESRSAELLRIIDDAKEEDEHLSEHTLGRIDVLRRQVERISFQNQSDSYYYYAELLILDREISDINMDVISTLESAAAIRRREKVMREVKDTIHDFIDGKSHYFILKEEHNPPWGPFYILFYDIGGTNYEVYASEMGFTAIVHDSTDDAVVLKELQDNIDREIGGLYNTSAMKEVPGYSARSEYETLANRLASAPIVKPSEKRERNV